MNDLLDKIREQFECESPSKCMLESILKRVLNRYERDCDESWDDGYRCGLEEGGDDGIEE